MSDLPRFGQYAAKPRQDACPRHPDRAAVAYCKRCNRPTCVQCTVPTEVGSVCVDCAKNRGARRFTSTVLSSRPYVTYSIVGAAVAVFLIGYLWSGLEGWLAFNPLVAQVQPWRFVTVSLVHGSFFHLLFNMMMLYFIGAAGEAAAGRWRFLSLFLLSSIGGSVAVLAWGLIDQSSLLVWTVGASGAIYGLLGAVLVEQWKAKMDTRAILVLLAVNLLFSFANYASVSWQGHIGGLIVGALVAWMYLALSKPRPGVTERRQTLEEIAASLGVLLVLGGISWGIYQLLPLG